jgi:hypothetical protein
MIQFFFIFLVILGNSCLLSFLIYYNLILPAPILQELKFEFSYDKENLFSEINLICNKSIMENCIEIDHINYQILLNLDVSNSYISYSSSENIEIEMKMFTKSREHSVKRIFFFERLDNFSDFAYKIIMTPFRMIGYFNSKDKEILMMENYDNNKMPLRKIEFTIKNKNMNINHSHMKLIPNIGIIRRLLSYIKFIVIPIIFCISVFSQVLLYILLSYLRRKKI